MSTRPGTPSSRRTAATTASTSRSSSPTKPSSSSTSSLNPSLPRQPSHPLLCSKRSTSTVGLHGTPNKAGTGSTGRLSPAKRTTASTNTLKTQLSTTSLASQSTRPRRPRAGRHSSDDPTTDDFDSDEEEEGEGCSAEARDSCSPPEVPTRKAGFGLPPPPPSPRKRKRVGGKESSTSLVQLGAGEKGEEEPVDGKAVNIVVCVRVRPTREAPALPIYTFAPDVAPPSLSFTRQHPSILRRGAMTSSSTSDEYNFSFDALHLPPKPTEELYDDKIRPVVRAAMAGFNGTVFAYGQTASGKTHTMMGSKEEAGVIPLAIDEVFAYIHDQGTTRDFSLRVSFLEIYNEQIRDLLLPPSSSSASSTARTKALEVVGDDGHIKGLSEMPVSMPSDVLDLLAEGDQRRRTGATDWNERSSRSHSVFVVTIESLSKGPDCEARTSRLNLIDLAGSEAATKQEERKLEGKFINKSLLTLSNVISKLSDPTLSSTHIPYRDSKLTRYLQPALSGKSRVAVICTISPDEKQAIETLSTLKFARRAGKVVTKAERGVLVTDAMVLRQQQEQITALQAQIAQREGWLAEEGGDGDGDSGELTRQLGEAAAKADEAERRGKEAEAALALKEAELATLRAQLQHAQSFTLNGPSLEANARRASLGFGRGEEDGAMAALLSPTRGGSKRIASDVTGLGLGTPRSGAFRERLMRSASGLETGSFKVGTSEKEAELERQLEDAIAKLTGLQALETEVTSLRSQVVTLEEARIRGEEEEVAKVRALEEELASGEKELEAATSRLGELEAAVGEKEEMEREQRAAVDEVKAQLAQLQEERDNLARSKEDAMLALQAQVEEQRRALVTAEEEARATAADLATKEALLAADSTTRDATIQSLQETIAALQAQLVDLRKERDELVARLEHELADSKKELAEVLKTRNTLVQASQDEARGALAERDQAGKAHEAALGRIGEVEELARLEVERHELAIEVVEKERQAAVKRIEEIEEALNLEQDSHEATKRLVVREQDEERKRSEEAELARKGMAAELEVTQAREAHLQRLVDAQAKLEAEQKAYVVNQRAGTDALAARMESIRTRSQTPTLTSTASLRSSTASRSSTSSARLSAGQDLHTVPELQTRNTELVARNTDLERQLQELQASLAAGRVGTPAPRGFGGAAALRRAGSVDTAKVGPGALGLKEKLEVEEAKRVAEEAKAEAADWKRKFAASERLLAKQAAAAVANESSSAGDSARPSSSTFAERSNQLPATTSEASRPRGPPAPISLSRTASTTPTPSSPARPTHTPQGSYNGLHQPPPLPYSPHNKEKDRTKRRITTQHDIKLLQEARKVDQAREMFDSPVPALPSAEGEGRRGVRGKKESWE